MLIQNLAGELAMAQATALREKEAAAYAIFEADREEFFLGAKAISAIEAGMAGFFIQTPLAKKLQNYAAEKADLPDRSRQVLISFLSGYCSEGPTPQSRQITGNFK